jgi:hypothetical protein
VDPHISHIEPPISGPHKSGLNRKRKRLGDSGSWAQSETAGSARPTWLDLAPDMPTWARVKRLGRLAWSAARRAGSQHDVLSRHGRPARPIGLATANPFIPHPLPSSLTSRGGPHVNGGTMPRAEERALALISCRITCCWGRSGVAQLCHVSLYVCYWVSEGDSMCVRVACLFKCPKGLGARHAAVTPERGHGQDMANVPLRWRGRQQRL